MFYKKKHKNRHKNRNNPFKVGKKKRCDLSQTEYESFIGKMMDRNRCAVVISVR